MMRMRLRTLRKAIIALAIVFGITCICLYMHAGYRELNKAAESDRTLQVTRDVNTRTFVKPSILPTPRTISMDTVLAELKFDNQPGGVWTQGFPITYNMSDWQAEPLEVFLVPHSHQDPGWVYTLDEYFEKKTRVGLFATLTALERNPDARFIYAEMSFFSKWVNLLDPLAKERVKNLLHNGQLEIVSGGWVMTDEATASYYAMVDQMIEGHHWLWDNFAYRPNVSWSIDPFGQSTTMAYLARKMGFQGMVIGRVHYEVKKYLAKRHALQFHWRQQWESLDQRQIPCHMLAFYAYDIPHTCGPDPSVCCQFDFLRLTKPRCPWVHQPQAIRPDNVAERAQLLIDQYRKKATLYNPRGVLLVPLGDDFRFLSLSEWEVQLNNYRQIIEYLDEHPEHRVKLRFATLSEYFRALHRRYGHVRSLSAFRKLATGVANNMNLPTFTGDLFTYADREHDYWSGYFTSRPVQKLITRVLESELRSSELLYTYAYQAILSTLGGNPLETTLRILYDRLTQARRSMGLFQHHDGVTGTAKPHVVSDYNRRLVEALDHCRFVSAVSATALLLLPPPAAQQLLDPNHKQRSLGAKHITSILIDLVSALNSDQAMVTLRSLEDMYTENNVPSPAPFKVEFEHLPVPVVLFNPLPQPRTTLVTLELSDGLYDSFKLDDLSSLAGSDHSDKPILIQVESPKTEDKERTTRVHIGPVHLAPLSMTQMVLRVSDSADAGSVLTVREPLTRASDSVLWLTSGSIELGFNSSTGFLKYLIDTRQNLYLAVNVDFLVYRTDSSKKSRSGAYLFVPSEPPQVMKLTERPPIQVLRGPLVQEVTVYTPLVNHTVRLLKYPSFQSEMVEIENIVDLSSVKPQNIELVMRIQTNITNTLREFYTDSNCFQFIRRQYYDKIPVQGNLYPMSCGVFIQSEHGPTPTTGSGLPRLNMFSSYAHGVTSPAVGQLYVWLDRRSPKDDDRGLGAALSGDWIAQSNFRLFAERVQLESLVQPGGAPVLTGNATAVLTDMLRPVQRFVADHHIWPHMSSIVQLMPQFQMPPDYELVALKTFHHHRNKHQKSELFKPFTDSQGAQIGMILHRLANPTTISDLPETNPTASRSLPSEILIPKMFSPLNRTRAIRTSLTMMPATTDGAQLLSKVSLNPMELDAFLLVV